MDQHNHSLQNEEAYLSLSAIASMRSLIINPSTPQPTISSILQTLIRSLQLSPHKVLLHHTLNLLAHLAIHHASLSHLVFRSVCSHSLLSTQSTRLAVDSLQVLASISESVPAVGLNMDELDDGFFVSLCFGPSVSARLWLLKNAGHFQIQPSVLFTVFLGFTKDPYPYVRQASLDGLVELSKHGVFEDPSLVDGCYCRAVQLLGDMEDCVRSSAIHVVMYHNLILSFPFCASLSIWLPNAFFFVAEQLNASILKLQSIASLISSFMLNEQYLFFQLLVLSDMTFMCNFRCHLFLISGCFVGTNVSSY